VVATGAIGPMSIELVQPASIASGRPTGMVRSFIVKSCQKRIYPAVTGVESPRTEG
jgi:hypothetical protein